MAIVDDACISDEIIIVFFFFCCFFFPPRKAAVGMREETKRGVLLFCQGWAQSGSDFCFLTSCDHDGAHHDAFFHGFLERLLHADDDPPSSIRPSLGSSLLFLFFFSLFLCVEAAGSGRQKQAPIPSFPAG